MSDGKQSQWREAKVSEPKQMGDRRVLLFKGGKGHIKAYFREESGAFLVHFD